MRMLSIFGTSVLVAGLVLAALILSMGCVTPVDISSCGCGAGTITSTINIEHHPEGGVKGYVYVRDVNSGKLYMWEDGSPFAGNLNDLDAHNGHNVTYLYHTNPNGKLRFDGVVADNTCECNSCSTCNTCGCNPCVSCNSCNPCTTPTPCPCKAENPTPCYNCGGSSSHCNACDNR